MATYEKRDTQTDYYHTRELFRNTIYNGMERVTYMITTKSGYIILKGIK